VSLDSLELQLASAVQRYHQLQRGAETQKDPTALLSRSLAELNTALEEVRVAQEQLVDSRTQIEELHQELRQQAHRYWRLFDEVPQPYVVSDPSSMILEVNKAGAELLNVSQRFLTGKALSVFVCEDRTAFLQTCARVAAEGAATELPLKIRPRERAPLTIDVRVSGDATTLRWLFKRVD
jgi:PAS domain-containing protein